MITRNFEKKLKDLLEISSDFCKRNNVARLTEEVVLLQLVKTYAISWRSGTDVDLVAKFIKSICTPEEIDNCMNVINKKLAKCTDEQFQSLPGEDEDILMGKYIDDDLVVVLAMAGKLASFRDQGTNWADITLEDLAVCAVGLDKLVPIFKDISREILIEKDTLIDYLLSIDDPYFKKLADFLYEITPLYVDVKLSSRSLLSKLESAGESAIKELNSIPDFIDKLMEDMDNDFGSSLREKRIGGSINSCSDEEFESAGQVNPNQKSYSVNSTTPTLDEFSTNLNELARDGKLDPVIGRDIEISQLIDILCCRKKNNAAVLGDPGCGKSALVEGLAQLIVKGLVPIDLKTKEIRQLNLNSLVAGTKFRGEYEERLSQIIKEVASNKNLIIYIDELHTLVGNGGSQGNGDAANILKPYLGRGEFQCIGATTLDEFNKFIAKDGALKRRFQCVVISEPTLEETFEILKGLSGQYSEYHKVTYTDDIIKACIDWSGKYVSDRYFPDKAIDVMDMAGSLAKLSVKVDNSEVDKLTKEVDKLRLAKADAIIAQDFEKAATFRDEGKLVEKKLEKLTKKLQAKREKKRPNVTLDNISKVISDISGIPVDTIGKSDLEKLRDLKVSMSHKVIGQPRAIDRITLSLQRNSLGLRDEKKPIASMLFVGPTGVGKTHICKELAKDFFGSTKRLIKFDMAEFSSPHEVTKLIGAGPSYVGYDDAPLFEQVRRNPYSVILFDEIEKAAPGIFDILLTILDEGTVTLANGVKVDFKNCIIILTGNIGTKELALKGNGLGFSKKSVEADKLETEAVVTKAVKARFRPELINRLSEVVVFNKLLEPELDRIFELEIENLRSRLINKNFQLEISSEVKSDIVKNCDPQYGARDLQRGIVRSIEEPICSAVLEKKTMPKSTEIIKVSKSKVGDLKVTFHKPKKETTPVKEEVNQ